MIKYSNTVDCARDKTLPISGNLNPLRGIPMKQEIKSFDKTNDSFKKIIVVGKSMKPRRNEKGYLMIGVNEFLLD